MRKIEEEHQIPTDGNKCTRCGNEHITTKQHKFNVAWFLWTVFIVTFTPVMLGIMVGMGIIVAILNIFLWIIPALIIGVILGFVGQGKVVNLCGVCGNSWEPGKQR